MLFNLLHPITILGCWVIGAYVGYVDEAVLLGVFYFIGRELAQAEYKWINTYGGGFRKNMPWYGSLDYRVWDVHSWFWNLSLPIVIAALIIGFN